MEEDVQLGLSPLHGPRASCACLPGRLAGRGTSSDSSGTFQGQLISPSIHPPTSQLYFEFLLYAELHAGRWRYRPALGCSRPVWGDRQVTMGGV